MFKISSSSTLAVIVHICIDEPAIISLGWYAGCIIWEILTSHLRSFSIRLSSLSISPSLLLSSLICSPRMICHHLLSRWMSESIPLLSSYGWTDPHTPLLYEGQEHIFEIRTVLPTHFLIVCDRFKIYYTKKRLGKQWKNKTKQNILREREENPL